MTSFKPLAGSAALAVLACAVGGCAAAPATPGCAGPDGAAVVGSWAEQGDHGRGGGVTTLRADGTLAQADYPGDAPVGGGATGRWRWLRWAGTPGTPGMPAGQDDRCVLWLHRDRALPADLVYVPLRTDAVELELSYAGRGNTVVWQRRPG